MKLKRMTLMILVLVLSFSLVTITAGAATKRPSAPEVTAANAATTGKIQLSWDAVEGVESYKIYRATSKAGSYKLISTTTKTSFTNSSVEVGDTYYYYVKAVDENGTESKASDKVSATCKLPRTTVMLGNSSISGKIVVSWKPIEGAVEYKVYRATSKNGTYKRITTTNGTSTTNTSTEAGKAYYYKVMAVAENEAANSAYSSVKSRTCDLKRPTITLSSVYSSGKIKISWNAIDGASSYKVYRSTDKTKWSLVKETTSTSLTNTSAEAGTVYYYRVKALHEKSVADSAYSSVRYRTCDLARPVVTVSNDATTGKVVLSWEPIEGAVEYKVYRAASEKGEYKRIKTVTETVCMDNTGEAGKTYYYRVVAVSSKSGADSAKSLAKAGTYEYLTDLTVRVELNEEDKPHLTWNEVKDAAKYKVYRSLKKTSGFELLTTTENTYFINHNASEGITYYYKVKAVNAAGTTVKTSNTVEVSTSLSGDETRQTRYVKVPVLNIYKQPDAGSGTVTLRYMDKIELGLAISNTDEGSWNRVFYKNKLYYMWLEMGDEKLTASKSGFDYTGRTKYQQQVIDLAMEICNEWTTVYPEGNASSNINPSGTTVVDCSNFAAYVLNTVMEKENPMYWVSSNLQKLYEMNVIYNKGYNGEFRAESIEIDDMQPGDVIFFRLDADGEMTEDGTVGHCGIYLGDNEFVHSTHSWEDSVCIMPLTGVYMETIDEIHRFLPEKVEAANKVKKIDGPYNSGYKLYAEKDSNSAILNTYDNGTSLTVLYTDMDRQNPAKSGNWAYVKAPDGTKGYFLVKHFG